MGKIKVLQALLVGVSLYLFTRNPVSFFGPRSPPDSSIGLVTILVARWAHSSSPAAPCPFSAPVLSLHSQALRCPSGGAIRAAGDSRPQVKRCPLLFLQENHQPTDGVWSTLSSLEEEEVSPLLAKSQQDVSHLSGLWFLSSLKPGEG